MLEKFDRVQVCIAAVTVLHPFSIFSAIIQIQHRGNRIHTQSVYMEFLNPIQGICDQEALNLVLGIVEYFCSPLRMLAHSGIGIFKQCLAVKICQTVGVLWKMGRYPVQNDTDLIAMQRVDQICKILRCSVTGGRCIIAGYLIAPGAVKRMLCDSHQLDVGIFQFFQIFYDTIRKFSVIIKSILRFRMLHPGTDVTLINCNRRFFRILRASFFNPLAVRPFKIGNICRNRSSSRTYLPLVCKRVCLVQLSAIRRDNQKFVKLSQTNVRNKRLINSAGSQLFHLVCSLIPAVKRSNHKNAGCVRCPDGKAHSFLPVFYRLMCAQLFVNIVMRPLSKQILVGLRNVYRFRHFRRFYCFRCLCLCHNNPLFGYI